MVLTGQAVNNFLVARIAAETISDVTTRMRYLLCRG